MQSSMICPIHEVFTLASSPNYPENTINSRLSNCIFGIFGFQTRALPLYIGIHDAPLMMNLES